MPFELPALPYERHALAPSLSARLVEDHYGRRHRAHVARLNALVAGTPWAHDSLEQLLRNARGEIFTQAVQVWNHTFYWHCLSPHGGGAPEGALASAIATDIGTQAALEEAFTTAAASHAGAGWAWLARTAEGRVRVLTTAPDETLITSHDTPLLVVDLCAHAYRLDYHHDRDAYLAAIWAVVDWSFVAQNFAT